MPKIYNIDSHPSYSNSTPQPSPASLAIMGIDPSTRQLEGNNSINTTASSSVPTECDPPFDAYGSCGRTIHLTLKFRDLPYASQTAALRNTPYEIRIRAFHYAMHRCDIDWPFTLRQVTERRGNTTTSQRPDIDENGVLTHSLPVPCKICGGHIYHNPDIGPTDILQLAYQFGLGVEHMLYIKEEDCDLIEIQEAEAIALAEEAILNAPKIECIPDLDAIPTQELETVSENEPSASSSEAALLNNTSALLATVTSALESNLISEVLDDPESAAVSAPVAADITAAPVSSFCGSRRALWAAEDAQDARDWAFGC